MSATVIPLCELREGYRAQRDPRQDAQPTWSREELAGRLTEISGQGAVASLTAAMSLVLEAQHEGEPTVWVTCTPGTFFPPDAAESGVDLEALAVVRVKSPPDAARACDRLVRSGAFGLIVLDLGKDADIPLALQGRLVGLAQRHDTAIVCLTDKPESTPSLGSMVSLRAEAMRIGPLGSGDGNGDGVCNGGDRYRCKVRVIKDKRRGPNWSHAEVLRGPAGLR